MTFSTLLRTLRESASTTCIELAEASGVSRQQVYRWEAGQDIPKLDALKRLAVALGCDLNAFGDS